MEKIYTWRQLLKEHGAPFLEWLWDSGRELAALDCMAGQLEKFLIDSIEGAGIEKTDVALQFWRMIPKVRSACEKPETFDEPMAAEAYAYVHLLERYRRTWAVLRHMTEVAVLPLGRNGTRVLDIGTGPAPALYAIGDFYAALNEFAGLNDIPKFPLPPPALDCIERSASMIRFIHHFSESCGRRGPFGPVFPDFAGLNLSGEREWYRRQNESQEYWDEETQQYESYFDSEAAAEANGLFRYRLLVFSNFLTLESVIDAYERELRLLFSDLRPGGVVIILGATGGPYQRIYERIAALAERAGLRQADWHTDTLGRINPEDEAAKRIKLSQHRVCQYLASVVGEEGIQKSKQWPDYWNPNPSKQARPRFALRIFRRGRWPQRTGHTTDNLNL